jgi:carbamoyltransferase
MIILGISGFDRQGHDSACCLIKDNRIIAFAEEERFSRVKHALGEIPLKSMAYCLKKGRITIDEIDRIAIGWDYSINPYRFKNPDVFSLLFPNKKIFKKPKVNFYPHHISHVASSFLFSGFNESVFMVIDGQGETESISIGMANYENNIAKFRILKTYPINLSLGYMYDKIGEFIGLGRLSAGKLMGLSSYGKRYYTMPIKLLENGNYKIDILDKFEIGKVQLDDGDQIGKLWKKLLLNKFGKIKIGIRPNQKIKNIAFTAQYYFQIITAHIINNLILKYPKVKKICIAGGAALNCVNNTKIMERFGFSDLFCLPAANDAGAALGAAALAANENGEFFSKFKNPYLGPSYGEKEIIKVCKKYNLFYRREKQIEKYCAMQLKKNKVIAWFQDRMEFGPRALGNRSIIASAVKKGNLDKLNKIKKREWWRPLAPIILAEESEKIFPNSKKSYFMLQTFSINKKYKKRFPVIEHIDGTSRPQVVKKTINKKLYKLLLEYKKLSGFGILVNTSFNTLKNEPIVCSPEDAAKNFINSGIDFLVIQDFIIIDKSHF